MPILTKEVEVIPSGRSFKYYKDLGYDVKCRKPLMVKIEDLSGGSNVKIQYLCDYCQKEVITMVYADYVRRIKEVDKMACRDCFMKKVEDTVLLRYGTTSYAKTDECQEKMKNSIMLKYGVEHYSQTQEYKEKWLNTCKEKYGENYRKKFANKAFETFRKKTGYNYPSQSPEVREKVMQSFYRNTSQKTSKQQQYINNLYQGILNFPIKYYNADIYLPNDNMIVEYDGGGHLLNVIIGKETIEEYNYKETVRYNVIKKEGYKQMRIITSKDAIPSDEILLQMLSEAKQYFFKYPNHSWIKYDIDKSIVCNAEHKNGISYNYGKLRKIKDSDLTESIA